MGDHATVNSQPQSICALCSIHSAKKDVIKINAKVTIIIVTNKNYVCHTILYIISSICKVKVVVSFLKNFADTILRVHSYLIANTSPLCYNINMVTKCSQQNLASVCKFYDEVVLYLTQHVNYPKWMYKSYPSDNSVQEATVAGTQYLCERDGRVVGAFVLNCEPQGAYQKAKWSKYVADGDYLVIHSFATHPDYYRQGVAEEMLNFCLMEAKRRNVPAIRLDVVPTNYPARGFYEKHGFSYSAELDLDRGFEDIPTFCLYEFNL